MAVKFVVSEEAVLSDPGTLWCMNRLSGGPLLKSRIL